MHRLLKRFVVLMVFLTTMALVNSAFADLTSQNNPGPFSPDIAAIKKRGVLVVAFYSENMAPFFSEDAQGNWTGVDIDLAALIAQQLNVKLEIKAVPTYDDLITMVANGKVDMGMGLLTITPQRALRVRFTDPYLKFHPHLLVNTMMMGQKGWSSSDVVEKMQDTGKALKLGALADSANVDLLQETFPDAQVVSYPTVNETLQAVLKGDVFGAVGNAPQQVHNMLLSTPGGGLKGADVDIQDKTVLIAIALPWQDGGLQEWLNAYLNYIDANNIKAKIFAKYGEQDLEL